MSVLALDIGSSRIKAMLAGWDGQLIGVARAATPQRADADGERSYPMDEVHGTVERLIADLTAAHPDARPDALVFSCLGTAMAPVAADGRPLGPALAPTDLRPQAPPWRVDTLGLDHAELRRRTGSDPSVASFLLHALWWMDVHPEVIEQAYRFRSLRGYVQERLSGADIEDRTWASRTMLVDLDTADWSPAILSAAGLPHSLLPSLVPPTTTRPVRTEAVERLGLAAGARIVVGAMDNCCAHFGAAGEDRSGLVNIVGTYEHMAGATDLAHARDVASASDAVVHGYLLEGQNIVMTRVALGELLAHATDGSGDTLERSLADLSPRPQGRPISLQRSAVDAALEAGRSRRDILQDLIEASAAVLVGFSQAWAAQGLPTEPIVVVGGGAHQEAILGLKATLLQRSVVTLSSAEGASLGALRLAAMAIEGATPEEACRLFANPIERTVGPGLRDHVAVPRGMTNT